ncbi:MAG TPA: hypothetical protein VIJ38_03790 [Acidobacteriaceae bacterium]
MNNDGDIARISSRGKLLDDNFYDGTPWTIGLKRFLKSGAVKTLHLAIVPLRKGMRPSVFSPHPGRSFPPPDRSTPYRVSSGYPSIGW